MIILALASVGNPYKPIESQMKWAQNTIGQLNRETQIAINTVYFSSEEMGEGMIGYFGFLKNRFQSRALDINGLFVILTPQKEWVVGNFYEENIHGILNISGQRFEINVSSFESQTGQFDSVGLVEIKLSTPEGEINRDFLVPERGTRFFQLRLRSGNDKWQVQERG